MTHAELNLVPGGSLQGSLHVPGDKSISHRALLLAALANGPSELRGLADGADVRSTQACLSQLGVSFETEGELLRVQGVGLHGLQPPSADLDCGNSGTTLRLLLGILAGQPFASRLVGDASLSRRPMGRVTEPLQAMGASIELSEGRFAPVQVHPAQLSGLDYHLPVASAQVKSALLLAGLYASSPVCLRGELASRDHSERLLPAFGVQLSRHEQSLEIQPGQQLQPRQLHIPGDFSSAAFWLAGAALLPGSEVCVTGVSLNPTRTGFAQILRRMGADLNEQLTAPEAEPWGQIQARYSPLQGVQIEAAEIPFVIDEIPLLMLLATQAQGLTELRGAAELRIKESDRLSAMADNLRRMGIELTLFEDGFRIQGPQALHGAALDACHDHRIAMTLTLAALKASGPSSLSGAEVMAISYPSFLQDLASLRQHT